MQQRSVPGKFEYLPHPADLKIKSMGSSLEIALSNLIEAISATRDDLSTVQNLDFSNIALTLHSRRLTSLVFDLCQHYLELLETKQLLSLRLVDAKISQTKTGYTLVGDLRCVRIPADQINNDIKAPTYHEMTIDTSDNQICVTVVLDI